MNISFQPIAYRHVIFPENASGFGPAIGVMPRRSAPLLDRDQCLNSTDHDRLHRLFTLAGLLPQLLARPDGPRIWSVGCSDGAELYSLAMLLEARGGLRRASLLGTDCRADAIARAIQGSFELSAIKNVPAEFRGRYLLFHDARWRVHPRLRAATEWRNANVLATTEAVSWDLILCRNLAIYLNPPAVARLWGSLAQCLCPGGFLMLGKAERPYGTRGLSQIAPGIYQREGS